MLLHHLLILNYQAKLALWLNYYELLETLIHLPVIIRSQLIQEIFPRVKFQHCLHKWTNEAERVYHENALKEARKLVEVEVGEQDMVWDGSAGFVAVGLDEAIGENGEAPEDVE